VTEIKEVAVTFTETDKAGSFGTLDTGTCQTYVAAPPYRSDNAKDKSCPPAGRYKMTLRKSDRLGVDRWHIEDVPGHDGILIHKGNFAGDTDLGLKSDTEGCLLVGNAIGELAGQKCLINSKDAFDRLMADLEGDTCHIVIRWKDGVGPEKK
jgi:hypothetical protein